MSQAFKGLGTTLNQNGTPVAEITKVQRSGAKADFADVTNLSSPNSYKEWLPTTLEAGEVSFDANYLGNQDPTQSSLQTSFDSQTLDVWTIVLPSGFGTWTFSAYIASLDFDVTVDKEAKLSAKLKITGAPVFA